MKSPEEFDDEIGGILDLRANARGCLVALIRARDAEVREAGVRAGIAAAAGRASDFATAYHGMKFTHATPDAIRNHIRALDAAAIAKEAPRG